MTNAPASCHHPARRPTLPALVLRAAVLVSVVVVAACGGTQEPAPETSSYAPAPASPFTQLPSGREIPEVIFQEADAAFRAADYVGAQRVFGALFIVDATYRNNAAVDALNLTCQRLDVSCGYVFGRLTFMRDVFWKRYGGMEVWPPQQLADYLSVLNCFERGMIGDYQGALETGLPIVRSPEPGFATAANDCVTLANADLERVEQKRRADEAMVTWTAKYPCADTFRRQLLTAHTAGDWEQFVVTYPQYNACAAPISSLLESGVLEGDARVAADYDVAWSNLAEIDAILEDNRETYESTRTALIRLEQDTDYGRFVTEYNGYEYEEERLNGQLTSLRAAASAISGAALGDVERQIEAVESQLIEVRRSKRDVMGRINQIRRRLGLASREAP